MWFKVLWAAFSKFVLRKDVEAERDQANAVARSESVAMAAHDRDMINETLDGLKSPTDHNDRLDDLKKVEERFLRFRDEYAGKEIPQGVLNDIFMDYVFNSLRSHKTILNDIVLTPEDCRRVHTLLVTKGDLQPLKDAIDRLQNKSRNKSMMEHFAFGVTALFVICCTVWAIHTINSIPAEHRGAAFETMVNAVKEIAE